MYFQPMWFWNNVVQSNMMMIWVTSTSMVIRVFQSRMQEIQKYSFKIRDAQGPPAWVRRCRGWGQVEAHLPLCTDKVFITSRFNGDHDDKIRMRMMMMKVQILIFQLHLSNPAPRPPPESIGEIMMMMMRRRRRRGMRRRRSRIVMGMVMSA